MKSSQQEAIDCNKENSIAINSSPSSLTELESCVIVSETATTNSNEESPHNKQDPDVESQSGGSFFSMDSFDDENDTAFLPSAIKQQLYASLKPGTHQQQLHLDGEAPCSLSLDEDGDSGGTTNQQDTTPLFGDELSCFSKDLEREHLKIGVDPVLNEQLPNGDNHSNTVEEHIRMKNDTTTTQEETQSCSSKNDICPTSAQQSDNEKEQCSDNTHFAIEQENSNEILPKCDDIDADLKIEDEFQVETIQSQTIKVLEESCNNDNGSSIIINDNILTPSQITEQSRNLETDDHRHLDGEDILSQNGSRSTSISNSTQQISSAINTPIMDRSYRFHNPKDQLDNENAAQVVAAAVKAALAEAEEKYARIALERDALSRLYKQMNAQNLHEMQALRKQLEDKIKDQKMEMEQQYLEKEEQTKQMVANRLSAEYNIRISELQDQLAEQDKRHKDQLQRLDDEHRTEIDELIQQLDDVELEQQLKFKELHQRINEKETIISVLSSQLVEANSLAKRMDQRRVMDEEQINTIKEELSTSKQEISVLQKRIEAMKTDHKDAMENELLKRRKAVQMATDDVRAAAELQFTEANKHYLRLKHDYDATHSELKKMKDVHDTFVKDTKASEVAMLANLSKLKAELAAAEARVAEVTQRYSMELESIRLADRVLRSQLEEAQGNCASAHTNLAHLARENEELRKISEELMAIVEGNHQA